MTLMFVKHATFKLKGASTIYFYSEYIPILYHHHYFIIRMSKKVSREIRIYSQRSHKEAYIFKIKKTID